MSDPRHPLSPAPVETPAPSAVPHVSPKGAIDPEEGSGVPDAPPMTNEEWLRLVRRAFTTELLRLERDERVVWEDHLLDPSLAGRVAARTVYRTHGRVEPL